METLIFLVSNKIFNSVINHHNKREYFYLILSLENVKESNLLGMD